MFTIESPAIKAVINPKGAELTSLVHKEYAQEYMWSGDPAFWGKYSPVLFPIVGTLKNNQFFYKDQPYTLPRHGFARDQQFAVETQAPDAITFLIKSNEESLKVFPFHFEFRIRYTALGNSLAVTYEVTNTGKEEMYFSVGGHPAFRVPLTGDTSYDDYVLSFEREETAPRWPISPDGLIDEPAQTLLQGTRQLPLTKALFQKDALVLKALKSSRISLRSEKTNHGIDMDFPGFPFFGIWAAKNADFVCLEPWCGIADGVGASQQITEKEGINKLKPKEVFTRTWTVSVF
ncbi:aldose 1-epimerase family protein [Paraflavitalea sp. CAU 1676]|uniref:aldose 1-epimerase family protein n=1 Tax=Paraflavitalea sp. CAU 1676 TaxID=3032598 RepID=UPI0023DA96C0|nr:aldose 1-epimerase family protein [Paraflavitalea sp. CAU 1676]MDF2188751.1 aldose 1-epimerase family protein [Paraflavitalea sp. CAU 1676]